MFLSVETDPGKSLRSSLSGWGSNFVNQQCQTGCNYAVRGLYSIFKVHFHWKIQHLFRCFAVWPGFWPRMTDVQSVVPTLMYWEVKYLLRSLKNVNTPTCFCDIKMTAVKKKFTHNPPQNPPPTAHTLKLGCFYVTFITSCWNMETKLRSEFILNLKLACVGLQCAAVQEGNTCMCFKVH